jgi:serine/threonine-protein kinase SRPK3
MANPGSVVEQMHGATSDELPERWLQKWNSMDRTGTEEESAYDLQKWLEETYFDGDRREDLTRDEIGQLGVLLRRLLRFEPSTRASAREIAQDPWFRD